MGIGYRLDVDADTENGLHSPRIESDGWRRTMIERISGFWQSLTWGSIALGVGLFLGSLLISFLAIGIVMVKIPANYFSSHYKQDFLPDSHWSVRWGAVILKNVFGVFLIVLGARR